MKIEYALSNSFGFGGTTVPDFQKYRPEAEPQP